MQVAAPAAAVTTPIDWYLADQQRLSAVEVFSSWHDQGPAAAPAPGRYRNLLPAAPPGPGQQYAFEVDLDTCSSCKACVVACNRLNGLDADEAWRTVGTLVGTREPYRQSVTTTCHHCLDPACLNGCPVAAYEKDPVTGIVHHLDDQCIGCGYCTFTCPYEVPRLNPSRGIVRKCDMCAGRLSAGEAPACVQACPTSAISITVVDAAAVAARAELVPGAPDPSITLPTTRYRTARGFPDDVRAADSHAVRPGSAHPALALMLVLTQVAVGTVVAGWALGSGSGSRLLALAAGVLALAASLFHLGRPRYAFRAVLGMRRSWLSREIAAFSAFAGLAALDAVVPAALAGLAGVGCSVMIYVATRRRVWNPARVTSLFLLTTAAAGLAVTLVWTPAAALPLVGVTLVKLAVEASVLRHRRRAPDTDLGRSALLLVRDLRPWVGARVGLGLVGGVALPLLVLASRNPVVALVGMVALVAGELVERRLFFASAVAPRMPGGAL